MRPWARSIAPLGLVLAAACRGDDEAATPMPASAPEPAPAPAPEIAAGRGCGEAGPTPTPLPPTLARGMQPIGRGVLRAGESRTVGTVVVRYDASAWIGTMEVGHTAPAVTVEIDRAEADGGPWGAQEELHADRSFPLHVGPYRVDIRSPPGDPVESIDFTVARDACATATTIARSPLPLWMWLSTEAIQQHTYDLQGPLLQARIAAQGQTPRVDVSELGYQHWFTPRPGEVRVLRVDQHVVTIDEVTPGPGTRHEGAWIAAGDARVHARVRVEAAGPVIPGEAVAATSPCGDASPRRTVVPDALRVRPTPGEQVTLAPGERARLGALELERTTTVLQRPGPRPDVTHHALRLRGPTGHPDVQLGEALRAQVVRRERELLRLDPVDAGRLRVRSFALACPEGQVIPDPAAPTYVWLSAHGHTRASLGDEATPLLALQLHLDPDRPVLAVTGEQAHLSRSLTPGDVGRAYTIAGYLVEIVDVVAGDGTRAEQGRWIGDGPAPAVHVQVRVSPAT